MIDFTDSFSGKRLMVPSFADEYDKLSHRYSRAERETRSTSQGTLDFSATTAAPVVYPMTGTIFSHPETASNISAIENYSGLSNPKFVLSEKGASTHAGA